MRLEHCPFCGADMAGGLNAIPECAGRMQWLTCAGCGARGPEVPRSLPYAAVVDAWNKRAPDGMPVGDGLYSHLRGRVEAVNDLAPHLVEILQLCAAGDVDESTAALGWGDAIARAKDKLAALGHPFTPRNPFDGMDSPADGVTASGGETFSRPDADDGNPAP